MRRTNLGLYCILSKTLNEEGGSIEDLSRLSVKQSMEEGVAEWSSEEPAMVDVHHLL